MVQQKENLCQHPTLQTLEWAEGDSRADSRFADSEWFGSEQMARKSYSENLARLRTRRLAREEELVYRARITSGLTNKKRKPRLIDLFCGAGGMTLGFSSAFNHCFVPVFANDNNKYAVDTYNLNFGDHCVLGDINDFLETRTFIVPEADVVIGGPPCQGFSLLNKKRDGDHRKQLWRPFMEVVKRSHASIFLMENVPQLIKSPEFFEIEDFARTLGFYVTPTILCAADYGVPQTRHRAFILGVKSDKKLNLPFPPKRTHYNPAKEPPPFLNGAMNLYIEEPEQWLTVRDAIGDLKQPEGTEIREASPPYDLHFGRNPTDVSLKRYKAIPREGMNRFDLQKNAPDLTPPCWIRKKSGGTDLFGRLWWNRPAFTIRTEFYKPEKGRYLHPQEHRPITHREAARLQSFPDDFMFTGTKIEIAKQIGNAVPPKLAARVADSVYSLWVEMAYK